MAKATVIIEKVEVPQPPILQDKAVGVTLELSQEEADWLRTLVGKCTGQPSASIWHALIGVTDQLPLRLEVGPASHGTICLTPR